MGWPKLGALLILCELTLVSFELTICLFFFFKFTFWAKCNKELFLQPVPINEPKIRRDLVTKKLQITLIQEDDKGNQMFR